MHMVSRYPGTSKSRDMAITDKWGTSSWDYVIFRTFDGGA